MSSVEYVKCLEGDGDVFRFVQVSLVCAVGLGLLEIQRMYVTPYLERNSGKSVSEVLIFIGGFLSRNSRTTYIVSFYVFAAV